MEKYLFYTQKLADSFIAVLTIHVVKFELKWSRIGISASVHGLKLRTTDMV